MTLAPTRPSPRGEGESSAAAGEKYAIALVKRSDYTKRAIAAPLLRERAGVRMSVKPVFQHSPFVG